MRRGEIRLIDFEPIRGAEANKTRPAILVSNDGANARSSALGWGVVTVVPVTSNVTKILRFQVGLPAGSTGLRRDSKAQVEQVRAVAVERVGARLGVVPPELLADLDDALRLHLSL